MGENEQPKEPTLEELEAAHREKLKADPRGRLAAQMDILARAAMHEEMHAAAEALAPIVAKIAARL